MFIRIYISLLLASLMIGFGGCEKETSDYRKPYTGNFTFDINEKSWTLAEGVISDTSYVHEGKIRLANRSNELWIYIGSDFPRTTVLHEDGILSSPNRMGGKFLTPDSLEFTIGSGGLGGGTTTEVTGIRR